MPTFTFQDIFKSSFLERLDAVSLPDAAIALALAFCLGLFIFLVYKKCYAGVMYAPSFGVTLIALTLITTLLILAVTSNIVLSLGMVGALSIVRFRTAIKEPMDIAFLFWAIAAGIVLAAGLIWRRGSSPWRWWAASLWGWCCWCSPGRRTGSPPTSWWSTAPTRLWRGRCGPWWRPGSGG